MMKTSLLVTTRLPQLARNGFTPIRSLPVSSYRNINTINGPDSQSFVLPDRRVLGFSEYGNPEGHPLIFFHGFPSSRLEARNLLRAARRDDLRVISPDRPGFGLSTFQRNRTIMDWPADMQALAEHLGLSKYSILGGSGGGPYALACALALPRQNLSAVGILAGAPPWEAGTKDLLLIARLTRLVSVWAPFGTRMTLDGLVGLSRYLSGSPGFRDRIGQMLERNSKGEDAETQIRIEDQVDELLRTVFEGFAQGSRATVQEARLLTQNWGFRLEDVDYDQIQVWHAKQDVNAPIGMIRYMVDHLPHATLREFEGTHFTIVSHLTEILSQLVPEKA